MHNGIKNQTIELSTGETYTPENGKPPAIPCRACKEKTPEKWGDCNRGYRVCAAYMDYEHMNAVYRTTVFD